MLGELITLNTDLRQSTKELQRQLAIEIEDLRQEAMHIQSKVIPAMERVRAVADALEQVIPDDLWTLPTYSEMLFIR